MNNDKIIKELTLEEKASLCTGEDYWHTKAVARLGIPSIMVADGPHGLRKQEGVNDNLGLGGAVAATCFPTASATACSWDIKLMDEIGKALAEECLQEKVSVILGPGANIKRSPLCGRNFEYISEDPYLTGEMAAAMIGGIQSKGVGASLKHYVLNNQETRRMGISAVVDERAKREIYMAGFERAVKKAKPWTVMCSYNKEDGVYLSEHEKLLDGILKQEWGFDGMVVSDWGASNDRVEGLKAGMDLEMPSNRGKSAEKIVAAVKNGELAEIDIDNALARILKLVEKSTANIKKEYKYDKTAHHILTKKASAQSSVLLKNEGILPLDKKEKILVLGEFAKTPRYQGAGSSQINPHKIDSALDALEALGVDYEYSQGYSIKSGKPDEDKIEEALRLAKDAEKVVIFAGLTDDYESEGYDREHLRMPDSHNELIKRVCEINENIIVVLQNGSPVEMPWIGDVKAVLENYLGGQAGSSAAIDILFGIVNPSGKLAETFPVRLEDNPSYGYFPGGPATVEYRESIYVGYRYYDKAKKDVLFPFGHGLSYTDFEYFNLSVKKNGEYNYEVNLKVKNAGEFAGAEIVQLYVKNSESQIFKAEKELKGFAKVFLEPGEEKDISFVLDKRSFAFYDTQINDWNVDSGEYGVLIGASSADIRLSSYIMIESEELYSFDKTGLEQYYTFSGGVFKISDSQFEKLLGKKLPLNLIDKNARIDRTTLIGDIQHKLLGRIIYKLVKKEMAKNSVGQDGVYDEKTARMMEAISGEIPLKSFEMRDDDMLPKYFVEGLVEILNNRFIEGLALMLKKK